MNAPVPAGEAERLDALGRYAILDSPPERDFDELVSLASQICRTPIAAISLIDADRQWFKAKVGLTATQTPRAIAFCAHAIVQPDLFVVRDALADPRFSGNPLVTADPHVRFYAGMPLIASNGHALGTLCVIDRVPRELTQEQAEALRALSRQVVSQLELRRTRTDLAQTTTESKTAQEALRESEEFNTRMVEGSQDCIKVLDLDGRLLSMNAGGMAVLEICDLGPIRNTSWIEFWQGEDREKARAAVEAARSGGVGRFVGYFPTTVTKKPLWWDVIVNPIKDVQGRPERLLAVSRDVTDLKNAEDTLRTITAETASATAGDFFHLLVRNLAEKLRVRYAFVAECTDATKTRVRTLAFWNQDSLIENVAFPLRGTPCEHVIGGQVCSYPERVQSLFPQDKDLVTLAAEGYLGVPLHDSSGSIMGHLALIHDKPLHPKPHEIAIVKIFAARAGAELERVRAEKDVRRLNQELKALAEINRAIGQHLNRDELFGALAACLKTLVPTERFGIELPIEGDKLQGHILTPSGADAESTQPTVLPARGTACDWVMQNRQWVIAASREELREQFPVTFDVMSSIGMESLCALPLVSGDRSRAALFFMTAEKGAYAHLRRELLEQVAGAVAVALDDCLAHEELQRQASQALAESEERFRDLFDEAPIAYVHEGLDTRFLRANRAAMRSLGIKPEEIAGTYGKSFIPDTPDAQRRLREALESIGRGTDTSGVVLELRRKDNGKPLWIQWWSRPDPGGMYTRTMFVDITDRVLMEQEKARLEAQNTYLQEEIQTEHNFEEVIGTAPAIKKVLRAVEQVAATDATVLITGETGTGKELIARAIHNLSPRKQGVLVKVNCAAIPAGLIESELFGHEKGAFTGALARKIGRFELADRATIFLDEVGEIPVELQTKLLRVLQEGEFERLGSTKTIKVNVRVVAATNRELEREVQEGRLRPDLYYRLNVFPIHLPALRDRKQDIPLLATYFIKKYAADLGKKVEAIAPTAMEALKAYPWPGNIRELEHVIERAIILSQGPQLELGEWLPKPSATSGGTAATTLEEVERAHILETLECTGWRVSGEKGAAKLLDLKPTTLEARMKKLGISRKR